MQEVKTAEKQKRNDETLFFKNATNIPIHPPIKGNNSKSSSRNNRTTTQPVILPQLTKKSFHSDQSASYLTTTTNRDVTSRSTHDASVETNFSSLSEAVTIALVASQKVKLEEQFDFYIKDGYLRKRLKKASKTIDEETNPDAYVTYRCITLEQTLKIDEKEENAFLRCLHNNLFANRVAFHGSYGLRPIVYCDSISFTKPLAYIENYICSYGLPFYGSNFAYSSVFSNQGQNFIKEVKEIIRRCVVATLDDEVIFCDSSPSAPIAKLIEKLCLKHVLEEKKNTVVIHGSFEPRSNIQLWCDAGIETIRISFDQSGQLNENLLRQTLRLYSGQGKQIICVFSVANHITGILADTIKLTTLIHEYGGLAVWDYVCAGSFINIHMNLSSATYYDAAIVSPKYFIGGIGTPGVLVMKKFLFSKFSSLENSNKNYYASFDSETEDFHQDLDAQVITNIIRCGLVFKLKETIGLQVVEKRTKFLVDLAHETWHVNRQILMLGNAKTKKVPIFSFLIKHHESGKFLHHNFVTTLLNDLYGIQTCGIVSIDKLYMKDLLKIDEGFNHLLIRQIHAPNDGLNLTSKYNSQIFQPGFTRIQLPFIETSSTIHYIINAVDKVATFGWKLLPNYYQDESSGQWRRRVSQNETDYKKENCFSLNDISFCHLHGADINCQVGTPLQFHGSLDEISKGVEQIFKKANNYITQKILKQDDFMLTLEQESANNVTKLLQDDFSFWFLRPHEAAILILKSNVTTSEQKINVVNSHRDKNASLPTKKKP